MELNFQCLTASELALQFQVKYLAQSVEEIGGEVAVMRRDCDGKVEDILFESGGLQKRLNATA